MKNDVITSINTDSKTGMIRTDEHKIQVSERWAGDGVYVDIETPARVLVPSTRMTISLDSIIFRDLFALLLSMEIIDLDEIIEQSTLINKKISSDQTVLNLS